MKLKPSPIIAIIVILFLPHNLFSQPSLNVVPDSIEFEDLFNRIDFVHLINEGNQVLVVDSIQYNSENFLLGSDGGLNFPFTVQPGDSLRMSITLSGFYNITVNDTSDTIYVFNNGVNPVVPIRISIDFYDDDFGIVYGNVRDNISFLENAKIYFIYNGTYIARTTTTNASGFYIAELPEANYTIAAEKDGYYVLFHDSTFDPYFADLVDVDDDDSININFTLTAVTDTSLYVSGNLYDSSGSGFLNKGIVVTRRGNHVPGKITNTMLVPTNISAGFVKPNGSFKINILNPNYYYVQAHTNYYLPGYFNDEGNASVYWENADTVLINGSITGKDIYLLRDSSYGAGSIGGNIIFQTKAQVLFEDITLLARNISNNALYSYNFGKKEGLYRIFNLPYGTYEITAQKIGWTNAYSKIVVIDPNNNQYDDINIIFSPLSVGDDDENLPHEMILYQNYPNPFNPSTNISFYLPESGKVTLKIVNILGETVSVLIDGELTNGFYNVTFNAGKHSSGVYIAVLESNDAYVSKKLLLLK